MYRKTKQKNNQMPNDRDQICLKYADYIIRSKATVRQTAKVFGVGKSSVHVAVTKRLPRLNRVKYLEVRKVLDHNKDVRHLRGGEATKKKYQVLQGV